MLNSLWRPLSLIFCLFCLFFSTSVVAQNTDSLLSPEQRRIIDSTNIRRGYLQSKYYRDSVEQVRLNELAALRAARKRTADSLTAARRRVSDSLIAARKHYSDSVRAYNDSVRVARALELERIKVERQRISDSMAAVRAYRSSKGYKDSLTAIREHRQDSLATARRQVRDSIAAAQKVVRDSTIAARKQYNDSLRTAMEAQRAERMRLLDSMAVVRQSRADSMAKVREVRAAERKSRLAKRTEEQEKKKSLALELKIKRKQEAYTNEKMLRKKWSLPRQLVQNTFTRYNYYFNADLKMDEAIDNMLRSKYDNYDSLISLFPFDPDVDSMKLAPDMDTIIRKASVGIQIHDPRAKWQDDLYLLVGQAYYYRGDYQNATAAFQYIIAEAETLRKEKAKKSGNKGSKQKKPLLISEPDPSSVLAHKSVKNDAVLWLSRTLAQARKEGQAQALLDMLEYDENFPERLKSRLALEQAFIHLRSADEEKAAKALETVVADKDMPQWLRLRASYLTAQLLQKQGKYAASSEYFAQVSDLNPNLEMDFYARKNRALNQLHYGNNKQDADDLLLVMTKDAKFRPFYDQVYFALGKTALQQDKKEAGMAYLEQSLSFNQNNKKQRGLTYAALGDEYYDTRAYLAARKAYDSAAAFLSPQDEPYFSIAQQRAQALDKIAAPGEEVRKQDSLLALSRLPESAQRKVVRAYIRDWEKKQNDSVFRAQNAPPAMQQIVPQNGNGTPSWYFANPDLVRKGIQEFKMKWGDRPLKDNWRRSAAGSADFEMDTDLLAEASGRQSLDEDSLLAAIPNTPQEIEQANQGLKEGLYQLGKGYYTYLEDYPNASNTFDTLDKRYPENDHEAEVLYTRYLMALRQNDQQTATQYNSRLQSAYPESEWARMVSGTSSLMKGGELYATNTPAVPIASHYDETYGLLVQRQYASVLNRVADADEIYPRQGDYKNKYTLMKAIAIAGTGNYPEADSMLSQFVAANPDDGLTDWANSVLQYIRKQPYKPAVTQMPTDSVGTDGAKGAYSYDPKQPHLVLIAAIQDARLSAVKSALMDYNLMQPGKEDIVINMSSLNTNQGLVICRGFVSATDAGKYLTEIGGVKPIFSEYNPGEYELLLISEANYNRLIQSKDLEAYRLFFKTKYK